MKLWGIAMALALLPAMAAAQQHGCRKVEFDGAVARGQEFQKAINPALEFRLQPLATGWRIRVMVQADVPPAHDAAEVATPPYASVNPLLMTTDFNFRAQDVVSWNPRNFQFVTDAAANREASDDEDSLIANPAGNSAAEKRLIALANRADHGEFRILNTSLVPGAGDQAPAASAVASHWRTTPHTEVQPGKGESATALGAVESLKFRVTLWMPAGIPLAHEWRSAALARCP